jgi:2-polyprenyl-3-methyl-5-hydroxy-6-metoxy-1,4-benzoquinol methylase
MVAEHVASVHGVDTSAGMIDVARTEVSRRQVLNVDFSKSDIFSEGFVSADFDVVVAFNVLHYASDVEAVCTRLAELLVPDGLFISSTACLAERRSLLGTTALLDERETRQPTYNTRKASGSQSPDGCPILRLGWSGCHDRVSGTHTLLFSEVLHGFVGQLGLLWFRFLGK